MLNKKDIFIITSLAFFMSAPAAPGWNSLAPNEPADRTKSIHRLEFNRKSIVVAENEPAASDSGSQTTTDNKDQAPDSGAADKEKSGNNTNDTETKPLKPFKPSEEIAAEQAVDYPVDI